MAEEVKVKRGRGRPKMTEEEKAIAAAKRKDSGKPTGIGKFLEPTVAPGDNSRYLRHALAAWDLPPIDISDPEQVRERLKWYFTHCFEEDMKPTVNGFCNALGIARQTLYDWKNGNRRLGTHQTIILQAYNMMEELWEDYMLNGKINPVAGIFIGKNFWGYTDKQEYVLTPNANGGIEERTPEELEAKYAELPLEEYDQ